jgi:hypothetical protein
MKSTFLALLLALSSISFAATVNPADEKTVLAAEKQYADAMVKGDVATLEKILADDLSYTHSNVLIETKADVLKGITSGKTKYNAIEFKSTNVRQYGNTIITNHQMIFAQPQRMNNVYVTMVWVKQPSGAWQMVQRQATRYPE